MLTRLVSIIVPCFNQAQYLDEALESVFNQTYKNWECIIINDGSPDHTEEVAKKWLEKDSRFIYLYKENGGLSSARNFGLEKANGDFIQFLDSDDFLDAKKIELSLEIYLKYRCEDTIVISNFRMFTDHTSCSTEPYCELKQEYFTFLELLFGWENKFSIPIHCGFFQKSLLDGFKFSEELKAKEDWIMWLQVFQNNNCYFLDKPLALYRIHPNSMTKDEQLMSENQFKAILVLKAIVPQAVYNEYLVFVLKQKNQKIISLENHINNYKKTKGYRVLEKLKNNSFIAFFIKLCNKIC